MISVIVCGRDPQRLRNIEAHYREILPSEKIEFMAITNARSLAEPYNAAIQQTKGDIVILCHDDIRILSKGLGPTIRATLAQYDLLGVVGTTALVHPKWTAAGPPFIFGQVLHPSGERDPFMLDFFGIQGRCVGNIQAIDGLFLAARRQTLMEFPFDAATFDGFHLYDIDLTYRMFRADKRLCVRTDIHIYHESTGHYDNAWAQYAMRFIQKYPHIPLQPPRRKMQWAGRQVATLEEAERMMSEAHLADDPRASALTPL